MEMALSDLETDMIPDISVLWGQKSNFLYYHLFTQLEYHLQKFMFSNQQRVELQSMRKFNF